MKVTKKQLDKQKKEKNNWGGAREDSKLIKIYADEWCKDNGYPVRERRKTKSSQKAYLAFNFILP